MSEFNPRAYMQAQSETSSSEGGPKLDGLTISVLIAIGLAGGLFGYNTLMDFRNKNKQKLGHIMTEAERIDAEREAQQKDNIDGISLVANYANGMMQGQAMANDVMEQLERNQHITNNNLPKGKKVVLPKGSVSEAKAFLTHPKTNAGEFAKYTSAYAMINRCKYDGYYKTRLQNYRRQNIDQVKAIKAALITASKNPDPRMARNGVPQSLQHIKTEKDAMKFVLSGGAERHMADSMGKMAAMSNAIKPPREWSPEACTYLNQSISSGKLNVKRRKA